MGLGKEGCVPPSLAWPSPPGRDKARRRRKKKCSERDAERHLDREAGLWHSVVAQNSKLYVFGGTVTGISHSHFDKGKMCREI